MRKLIMMLTAAIALGATLTGFGETVTNVRGAQRPNSNLVDIYYDLNASDGGTYTVEVAIEGRTNEVTATTFSGDVGKGIAPGKNRHIVWESGADWRNNKGDVMAIVTATIEARIGKKYKKVQLWEDGPYWADRNIGAENPWDYGLYFWWGDTTGYRREGNAWVASDGALQDFRFGYDPISLQTSYKTIYTLEREGWVVRNDGTYVLAPEHDAAHVQWGSGWRMPTYYEFLMLCSCDWTWTTMNGVNGYVVRGRGSYASNSIFLPCAGASSGGNNLCNAGSEGLYWSSEYHWYDDSRARSLDFDSGRHYMEYLCGRQNGFSIRPVQRFDK